ncbi:Rv3235 family protein [Actinomadura sp. 21ATH]|uniref:Rv3235 family protein n=1 Tax=Actinomadura sp. 21ATH TaxID=1735444 RepID=UPI0035BED152
MMSSHAVVRIVPKTTALPLNGTLALRPEPVPPAARRRTHLSLAGGPPRGHAEAALRIVIDILAGTRPPRHLSGTADPEVWQGLAVHRAGAAARTRIVPPRVLRTWAQAPAPGALEAGAVAVLDGRVHALALRLERRHGRWRCTAIETTVPA